MTRIDPSNVSLNHSRLARLKLESFWGFQSTKSPTMVPSVSKA